MVRTNAYIKNYLSDFGLEQAPWKAIANIENVLGEKMKILSSEYEIKGTVAIHKTARVEQGVIIKGLAIISANVFIGAHAYLRGGVYLDEKVVIGPGCEIKSSIIHAGTALAHFNFAGDSIIGSGVNMEAGSVIANHYNERDDKTIKILVEGKGIAIDATKFGALVGDGCRIGANAVLSPGTILKPGSIVKRLQLIEQIPE